MLGISCLPRQSLPPCIYNVNLRPMSFESASFAFPLVCLVLPRFLACVSYLAQSWHALCYALFQLGDDAMRTNTPMKLLNITRTDSDLFRIKSSFPHWSDGSPISGIFAFRDGSLSDTAAQTINRARGVRYLIISPLTIKSAAACTAAAALSIGESCAVEISPAS